MRSIAHHERTRGPGAVKTVPLPPILCDVERKRAIIVFQAEDGMSCDQRIARCWVMHEPGQAGSNVRSGGAPSCFHGVGSGPLFRFFTGTEIVVAVIRRCVTYKKHFVNKW
jgi:hypothetical protein